MNHEKPNQEQFIDSKLERFELSPLQIIGILLGLGLLALALFQLFKSSISSTGTLLANAPKLSATEIAVMLNT